jgi:hypothetical protein
LLALCSIALLFKVAEKIRHGGWLSLSSRLPLPAAAAIVVMFLDLAPRLPLTNEADEEVEMVRDVLALTDPDQAVFDCKGETAFRRRSIPYVLETLTLDHIARGELPHPLAGQSPEASARVAVVADEIPHEDAMFLETNYLPLPHGLMVAGVKLSDASSDSEPVHFEIVMPDQYTVITHAGPAEGLVDGAPTTGTRFLAVGTHSFSPAGSSRGFAVVWSQSVERHFAPILNDETFRVVSKPATPFLRPLSVFRH